MTFILAPKNESFYYPIDLPLATESGSSRVHRFEFRFKRLSRTKLNELQKRQDAVADLDIDSLERDVDYLMELADGWRGVQDATGVDVPFDRDALHMLIDGYPNAAGAIVGAFFEATLGGAKRKNL